MLRLLMACVILITAAFSTAAAAGSTFDGYLHNLDVPPACASTVATVDPTQAICGASPLFAPQVALTSQAVLVRFGDIEASQADCAEYQQDTINTVTIDGNSVPLTVVPCRYIPRLLDNISPLNVGNWHIDYRYLALPGTLAPGAHTLSLTTTFIHDFTYALGCADASGRCTIPAGTGTTTNTLLVG